MGSDHGYFLMIRNLLSPPKKGNMERFSTPKTGPYPNAAEGRKRHHWIRQALVPHKYP